MYSDENQLLRSEVRACLSRSIAVRNGFPWPAATTSHRAPCQHHATLPSPNHNLRSRRHPLPWTRVPPNPHPPHAVPAQPPPLTGQTLESLFGLAPKEPTRDKSSDPERDSAGATRPKKVEKVSLIDQQRAQNISIGLTQIRLPDEEIKCATPSPYPAPRLPPTLQVMPCFPNPSSRTHCRAKRRYATGNTSTTRIPSLSRRSKSTSC